MAEVRKLISIPNDTLFDIRAPTGTRMMILSMRKNKYGGEGKSVIAHPALATPHCGIVPLLLPTLGALQFSGPCQIFPKYGHHARSCLDCNNHVYLVDSMNTSMSSLSLSGLGESSSSMSAAGEW